MIEVSGNLWSYKTDAQVRVITTNGTVKANGENVMGKGCAEEAARIFPSLPALLGKRIKKKGNTVQIFNKNDLGADYILVTLPVKHEWFQNADADLIFKGVCELADVADFIGWSSIILPRPGCGAGNLSWEKEVKPLIKRILDDRFYVITYG